MVKIVDIASARDILNGEGSLGSDSALSSVADALMEALRSEGFIVLRNHGVEAGLIREVMALSREFFQLPPEQKALATSPDKARRGYCAADTENFASLLGRREGNDSVEKFRIGPLTATSESLTEQDADAEYFTCKEGRIHFFPNTWNGVSAEYRNALERYYREMEKLSMVLARLLEVGCSLPMGYFQSALHRHTSILAANYFLPLPLDDSKNDLHEVTRVHPHTDISMFTVVAPSAAGLEILDPTNQCWQAIPIRESCIDEVPGVDDSHPYLVVNVGDCLRDWSGGLLASTVHRVIEHLPPLPASLSLDASKEDLSSARVSLAYFATPNYNCVLDWPHDSAQPSIFHDKAADLLGKGFNGKGKSHDKSVEVNVRVDELTVLTYSQWRTRRIAKSIKILRNCCLSIMTSLTGGV